MLRAILGKHGTDHALHYTGVDLYMINPTPSSDTSFIPDAGQRIAARVAMAQFQQIVNVLADAPIKVSYVFFGRAV